MSTEYFTDWQLEQAGCECVIHRYHVAHLCSCGRVISHSQADWDTHRFHEHMINFEPKQYKHGDSFRDVFDRLSVAGTLPYGTPAFEAIYTLLAEAQ